MRAHIPRDMPRGGKIQSRVVKSTLESKDVMNMFQGVLGTGEGTDLNMEIVYPKYLKARENCDRFMRLLEVFRDSAVMGRHSAETGHLAGYIADLRANAAEIFTAPNLGALHPPGTAESALGKAVMYSEVTREEYDAFADAYTQMKNCKLVNAIIVTCKNLSTHKKALEDREALSDRFLTRTGGLTFAPLPMLTALNFKQIYSSDVLTAADREYIMVVLHKLYAISHDVYETMSSPDIDVNEFVHVIMASIDDVKKHIPRCDEAFEKIRESVGLLKGNFDGYYKEYVATDNPTIIMENFVLDVSKTTQNSARVTGQFRRIVSHYKKLASQQATDPKLRTLFQKVDQNFQELEQTSRGADDDDAPASGEGADSDGDDGAGDGGAGASAGDAGAAAPVADPRQSLQSVERQFEAALASAPPASE